MCTIFPIRIYTHGIRGWVILIYFAFDLHKTGYPSFRYSVIHTHTHLYSHSNTLSVFSSGYLCLSK